MHRRTQKYLKKNVSEKSKYRKQKDNQVNQVKIASEKDNTKESQNTKMVVIATKTTMKYNTVGRTVRSALMKAQTESRLIVGLGSAIKVLSKAPEGSLFCIMAEPQAGDSATHMHEVLLQAFCYENDIYVIKVDSADKLSRILNMNTLETCCLVQKTWTGDNEDDSCNKLESILVDHCEDCWDLPQQPIIELPVVWMDITFWLVIHLQVDIV